MLSTLLISVTGHVAIVGIIYPSITYMSVCLFVNACVSVGTHVPWHTYVEGGQPWLSTPSSTLSLVICCCVCQPGWPISFQGLPCLCLPSCCRGAGVTEADHPPSKVMWVLGIWVQVLMLVYGSLSCYPFLSICTNSLLWNGQLLCVFSTNLNNP